MIYKKDPDLLKNYFEDSSNLKGGHAEQVVIPENINELSRFLKTANDEKIPVTVSGGGTSTTGSRIPFGGVVVSMERLNNILKISKRDMTASLQAGVMVDELKKAVDAEGLFYASHPTEHTATVGGTVATNASGARSFKYGATRDYVKRLKMVLASGEILEVTRGQQTLSRGNSKIILPGGSEIDIPIPSYKIPDVKSASGYYAQDGMDLIDLFIGQEGTLSVIAEVDIGLVTKPQKILSCFVFFGEKEDAWSFAAEARATSKRNRAGDGASSIDALSIEYFDPNAINILRRESAHIPEKAKSAIYFEQETMPGKDEDRVLNEWLELIRNHGASLDDTWVAMSEKDTDKFLRFRYAIPEAVNDIVRKNGFQKLSTDISVPDDRFLEMMKYYNVSLTCEQLEHVIFGHIGENHVHVNILPRSEEELERARDLALKFVKKGVAMGGAISAEHGIGKIKHKYLEEMYGTSGVLEMSKIKKAFDPNCILGLNNIFTRELLK